MSSAEKKHLRIGVLGFGAMGRTHTWAVRNLPFSYAGMPFTAETVGVCTTTPEGARAIADQFSIRLATACEDELINDPSIDVIDVCTPNVCHFSTLKKAIAAGKHVLCEKPLCTNLEEARRLSELPRREGQILGMVFNNRYLSAMLRAKQLIDEGRLGRILSFDASYLHSSATDLERNAGWKQDRRICGGGTLFDLGSHVIDLISYLIGRFSAVSGLSQIAYPTRLGRDGTLWRTNADESFYLLARTHEGACGTLRVGKIQVGTNDELSLEIYGERGSLRFSLMEPNWLYFYDHTRADAPIGGERGYTRIECVGRYPDRSFPSPKAPAGWLDGHLSSMYAFLSAVAEGRSFSPSLEDGVYVQAVLDAATRSAEDQSRMTEVILQ